MTMPRFSLWQKNDGLLYLFEKTGFFTGMAGGADLIYFEE